MEDTTISVIGILVATIIMFIVPLILIAERSDDISQLIVQTETAKFVDEVIKTGKITNNNYQRLFTGLESSGNTYDVDIEVKILDRNTSKVVTDNNPNQIGENTYYSIFSSQIIDKIVTQDKLVLKQGDAIYVTVKNNNQTLSQSLKSFYYNATGGDLHIIVGTASGTVAINGAT